MYIIIKICFFFKNLAAVSHPAYKLKWIDENDSSRRQQAIELLREEKIIIQEKFGLTDIFESQREQQVQPKTAFSLDYEDEKEEDTNLYSDEIDKWVKTKLGTIKDLEESPIMKHMFLKFNTGLGSQASVERVFSFAKLVFGDLRKRLGDKNFEQQLLLKANKKLNPKLLKKKEN